MKKTLYSALITFIVMCPSFRLHTQSGKIPVLPLQLEPVRSHIRGTEYQKRAQPEQSFINIHFVTGKALVYTVINPLT